MRFRWILIAVVVITLAAIWCLSSSATRSAKLETMIMRAERGQAIRFSPLEPSLEELNWLEARQARAYIIAHPSVSSYHLLIAVRRCCPITYGTIDRSIKTAILCDALAKVTPMDDWGTLDDTYADDRESAQALLELGKECLTRLTPLLDDRSPVICKDNGETSAISFLYQYRCCDYAYRYICILEGVQFVFPLSPAERDEAIQRLKERLAKRGIGRR